MGGAPMEWSQWSGANGTRLKQMNISRTRTNEIIKHSLDPYLSV
jgi:hypothetical protein